MTEKNQMSHNLTEVEPGLRTSLPASRLSHSENRCLIAYYLQSPLSADGSKLLYFEFDRPEVDRRCPEAMRGRLILANPDGSAPLRLEEITVPSPSSGAQAQWCGEMKRIAHFLVDENGRIGWQIIDLESGQRWGGEGSMRHISPDGRKLSIQNPNPYDGREGTDALDHGSAAATFLDYESGEELFRVSVADMLSVHPKREQMEPLHLGIKKPLFSPGGRHLSFVLSNNPYRAASGATEPRHHELLLADADGSNLRYLCPFVTHPSWHPTGTHFCALVRDPDGELAFGLYPVDGSDPIYWRHPALRAGHPSVQPVHCQYLVNDQFDHERGVAELWLYSLGDWSEHLILEADYADYSNESGTHLHPAWSPDGRSVFFNSAHSGPARVYRIELDPGP